MMFVVMIVSIHPAKGTPGGIGLRIALIDQSYPNILAGKFMGNRGTDNAPADNNYVFVGHG